ncbi:DNA primase [Streptomyces sp. NBC_00285]|uniref:DNA primase n=1 Tax=Streptomyces sp. NBC_00285 TaxID=2975700 RepID=UPI002E2CD6FC|nr:DNA primase [Streptomyces sp. NBC_00285]
MNRVGLGLAIGAGYVLGRTKKLKLAFAVGTVVAGKKMNLTPRALADLVTQQLLKNPQFKEIGDTLRQDLRGVGKAASGAMVERQINAVADRLHGRTAQVRDQLSGVTPDLGFEDEDEETEDEESRAYDDSEAEADERDEAAEADEGEVDDEDDEEPQPRRRRPEDRAAGGVKKAAKKAPAKKTAENKPPAKRAPAKKTAAKTAAKKSAARKSTAAGGGARGARTRLPKGGGE